MLRKLCLSVVALFAVVAVVGGTLQAQESKEPEAKSAAPAEAGKVEAKSEESPAEKKADDHGHSHAAGGDHAHHDEFDNTHANASAGLKAPQEMRFDLAIATFVIFILLLVLLAKFAWGPIISGLDSRESHIASMIDQARLAQEQAEAQLRSYEAKLAAATEEARQIVGQARTDAEAAKDRILAEAKDAATKERERAIDDITIAKNAALQQIAEKSVNTAISLASSIVRRELKPEDHDQLVTDALGKFSKLN
ncbi:ATP synthase subunit b [Anatilimnocola aggregata]|uniref:ATP synthase subunit b n=1 Tax=Anatilimnocola aggregata TaxID=2528021 RepID=A0A517YEX8_9BACT|nr:F0F1 ATP synthase subunit B [Anatilimnocola aggregata]QDU28712.1 ATP synthase subunit b [Anatilimnocola aggregata]